MPNNTPAPRSSSVDPSILDLITAAARSNPVANDPSSNSYDPNSATYVIPGMGVSKAEGNAIAVFMGGAKAPAPHRGRDDGQGGFIERRPGGGGDRTLPVDEAAADIYKWSTKKVQKWADHLVKNGLLKEGEYTWDDLVSAWRGAVAEAGNLYTLSNGRKKVTPWGFVDVYAAVFGKQKEGKEETPKTTTSTDISYQEIDDIDARSLAEEAYAQAIGQAPDQKQTAALKAALSAYAKEHPQVTTRTVTRDAEGNESSASTQSGGMTGPDAQQIAQDQAQANPTFAEFQAAGHLFPLLQQALGATADVDSDPR